MKQSQIVKAYKVIEKYEDKELPLDISFAFFKLKKLLQAQWDFQIETEKKIFGRHKIQQTENNVLQFETAEDTNDFFEELNDLAELDVDLSFKKIKVNIGDRMNLSIADLEALDEFMEIE